MAFHFPYFPLLLIWGFHFSTRLLKEFFGTNLGELTLGKPQSLFQVGGKGQVDFRWGPLL